jgi:hypothetical protein
VSVGTRSPVPTTPRHPAATTQKGTAMLIDLELVLRTILGRLRADDGFSTAELLGNAALGIAALVAIWALLTNVGRGVIDFITSALGI